MNRSLMTACGVVGALSLLGPVQASTLVFQFGTSTEYVVGKTGFGGTDPRYESGNQPFRNATTGAPQTNGTRSYSETLTLTGPPEGINVGGTPTSGNSQTFSGYSGPQVYGGYSVVGESTAVFASAHNPFVGYGSISAIATSGTYFQTGLRNITTGDRMAVNSGYNASPSATVAGNRVFRTNLLTTAKFEQAISFESDSSISYIVVGANAVRAVIKKNNQYYVLDQSKSTGGTGTVSGSFSFGDLSTGTWTVYDPLTNLIAPAPAGASLTLDNITWAGILTTRLVSQAVSAGGTLSGNFAEVAVQELAITAVIPEPASFGFLSLTAPLLLARRGQR